MHVAKCALRQMRPCQMRLRQVRPCQVRPCQMRLRHVRLRHEPSAARVPSQVAGGLRGECVAMAQKFRSRSVAERVSFIQRANAAKAAGFPSWKAMQREAKAHEQYGTTSPPAPHVGGAAPDLSHASESDGGEGGGGGGGTGGVFGGIFGGGGGGNGACGECDPEAYGDGAGSSAAAATAAAAAGVGGLGGMAAGKASSSNWTSTPEQRAAATKAGFHPSNETTHGMTTEQLRQKLSEAGIGVRAATAGDFGFGSGPYSC